jgi:hypothetical protein
MNLLSPIGKVYHSHTIGKGCIGGSIGVYCSFGAVGITNFFGAVDMMVFDLFIGKMVGLFPILVGYLCSLKSVNTAVFN